MTEKQHISGFGGFFFRAKDPSALAAWYEQHFGINKVPTSYDEQPWAQQAGPTVFAPFPADSDFFGPDETKTFMFNFRVTNLADMVATLQASGIEVEQDPQIYPNGIFAKLYDPEGNPIQLWEPQNNPS